MDTAHARLKHRVMEAIDALFSDRSVSLEQTLESLEEIESELGVCICALEDDIARLTEED